MVVFNKKITTKKSYKYIILGVWITLLILELILQFIFTFDIEGDKLVLNYNWYIFLFQFCSSPHYLLPFIVFLPDCKAKKRIELFAAIFILFGGILGSTMPAFSPYLYVNYQTLIHHGSMIIIAIYIAINNKEELKLRNFLETIPIFLSMLLIAIFLNWIIPKYQPITMSEDYKFNMFFISWHCPPNVVILKDIWNAVPYPVYLLIYILGFILLCFVIYIIYSLILNHKVCLSLKSDSKKIKSTKKSHK